MGPDRRTGLGATPWQLSTLQRHNNPHPRDGVTAHPYSSRSQHCYASGGARLRMVSAIVACMTVVLLFVTYPGTARAWSQQVVPTPPSSIDDPLMGVSCTSGDACTAVGEPDGLGLLTPFDRWNGHDWSLQTAAQPDGVYPYFSSISCVSNRSCFAVGTASTGDYSNIAILEGWDGSAWSSLPGASQFANGDLGALSCASRVACMAAGADNTDGSPEVGRWDGRAWSGQTLGFYVNGLSCVSRNVCSFVGRDFQTSGPAPACAFAGFWTHGRWSQNLALPCHSPGGVPELSAVSCSSASACTAVGSAVYGWNGQRWMLEPNALRHGESVHAVSCASRTVCVAVGSRRTTHTTQAVVKRWNGARWSTVYVSKLMGSELNSVSCTSATVCRAVGYCSYNIGDGLYKAPLVESNG